MAAGTKEPEAEVVEADAVELDVKSYTDEELEELAREQGPGVELARIDHERAAALQPSTTLPTPMEWEATLAVAKQIAATPFVPESYRNQPESVVAAILTGRELGIGPMQALRDIHMIDGRPAFSAQLLLAKLRGGGVVILESESTEERAWIKARRTDTGEEGEFEFTVADATKAGLTGKKNWKTYPSDMLWARAVSRMARRFGSDLLGGLVFSKEEIEDWDDGGYGGHGTGYAADLFDPGKQLLPNARRAETATQVVEMLREDQKRLAPDLDWDAMLSVAATACIGPQEGRSDSDRRELLVRWANTLARLQELADENPELAHEDLGIKGGPEGDALIIEAFAFGFDYALVGPLPLAEGEAAPMLGKDAPAPQEPV